MAKTSPNLGKALTGVPKQLRIKATPPCTPIRLGAPHTEQKSPSEERDRLHLGKHCSFSSEATETRGKRNIFKMLKENKSTQNPVSSKNTTQLGSISNTEKSGAWSGQQSCHPQTLSAAPHSDRQGARPETQSPVSEHRDRHPPSKATQNNELPRHPSPKPGMQTPRAGDLSQNWTRSCHLIYPNEWNTCA